MAQAAAGIFDGDDAMNTEEMKPGIRYIVDGSIYVVCGKCKKLIKESGIFGGLHICEQNRGKDEQSKR